MDTETFPFHNPYLDLTTDHAKGDPSCPECATWTGHHPRPCRNPVCSGGIVHVEYGDEMWDEESGDVWDVLIFLCDKCGKDYK